MFFDREFKMEKKNIFELIKCKNPRTFISNKETLEQVYFCFDSIINLTQKVTLVNKSMEEISVFSRELARNHVARKMPERIMVLEGDIDLTLDKL